MEPEPERIEFLKRNAFKPPIVNKYDDFKMIFDWAVLSLAIYSLFYYSIGFAYIKLYGGGWIEMKNIVLMISFVFTIIFAFFRTLRFTMSQVASDPFLIFPMKSKNVSGHLKELIKFATSLQWDLTGLIGSFTVLLITYYLTP